MEDILPPGLTPTAASGEGWSCQIAAPSVTCTRSDALVSNAAYPTITLRANVAANAQSDVNVVTVSGGGSGAQTDSDPYTVTGGVPNLTIGKSHAGDFTTGQTGAVYVVSVRNISTTPTSGPVVVQDSLPAQLVPTAASGDGWTCTTQAQVVSCRRTDSLPGGQSWPSITIAVNVLALPGTLTNVATVNGGGDATPADNSAADLTTIVGAPQLSIRKSHPSPVVAGQSELQFTIDVFNNGSGDSFGETRVTDEVPAGLLLKDVVGTGWSCQRSGATATCTRSDALRPDKSFAPIFVTVDVAADAQSTANRATVSGGGDTTQDDNVAIDNVVLTAPGQPNLTIAKHHAGPFFQGQQGATYSVRVTNDGLAATSGTVTVSDDVPAGLVPDGWRGRLELRHPAPGGHLQPRRCAGRG